MSTEHIEVLVEEPSMEAALRVLLPRMLGGRSFQVYPHQCKVDLLQRLPERLQGYAKWLPPDWRILVVVDQDNDDCRTLKATLEEMAARAGLTTRSRPLGGRWSLVNRLAMEELEAWYFGDWEAVRVCYPRVSATIREKTRFRDPDAISGGTWEAFQRVLQNAGYFRSGLRKIEAARAVASHMNPERNDSRSFQMLRAALLDMLEE